MGAEDKKGLGEGKPQSGGSAALACGQTFAGRYHLEEQLGRGAFGVVFRAFDTSPLQRHVALKIVRPDRSSSSERDIRTRQSFFDEARLAGSLSHANIAAVHEVGEADGMVYMTQELAPGRDLRTILGATGTPSRQRSRRGRLPEHTVGGDPVRQPLGGRMTG